MPGPKSDKAWADAIRMAVNEHVDNDPKKPRKLRMLASNLVDLAMQGESWAMQEVGNRLDGRPHQTSESTVTHKTLSADPVVSEQEWEKDHSGQRLN